MTKEYFPEKRRHVDAFIFIAPLETDLDYAR